MLNTIQYIGICNTLKCIPHHMKYKYIPHTVYLYEYNIQCTHGYHPTPKSHPKSEINHKFIPHSKHKAHAKYGAQPKYIPHLKHKLHLKTTPQTNSHQKPRRHRKQNAPIHNYAYHFITTKINNTHTTRKLNLNPKPKPKSHSKYTNHIKLQPIHNHIKPHKTHSKTQTLKPHNIHNYHIKYKLQQPQNTQPHNAMTSAYRPRHNKKPKNQKQKKNYT